MNIKLLMLCIANRGYYAVYAVKTFLVTGLRKVYTSDAAGGRTTRGYMH